MAERGLQLEIVKGAGARVKRKDADQKKCRGNECIEEELDRSARAVAAARLASEHGDEDGHGDEREFPEGVVDNEIEREKDAEHRGLLQQEERVELFDAGIDGAPGGEYADGREEAGEHDQPDREAIDAEVVVDGRRDDPEPIDLKLEAGVVVIEVRGQMQREHERGQRDEECPALHQLATLGK